MSKRKARYSAEFKQDAVMRMGQGDKTVTALAKQLGIRRKFLYLIPLARPVSGWR
jgi:transposase-like protein